jgi:Tetratricopeptide repeat
MRGRWDEAVQQCAEALQRQPANASAHSLLGDIYENRGRLEDAIHWYQLALELSPTSAADRSKLARARELLEARRKAGVQGFRRSGVRATAGPALRERLKVRMPERRSEATISWLRVVTVTGVAFCCTILALAIVFSASERLDVRLHAPNSELLTRGKHSLTAWRNGTHFPFGRSRNQEPGAEGAAGSTPQELHLLAQLQGAAQPPGGEMAPSLRADGVWLDPRTAAATVRASLETFDRRELRFPDQPRTDERPAGQATTTGTRSGGEVGGGPPSDPRARSGVGDGRGTTVVPSAVMLEREVYRLASRLVQSDRNIALVHVQVLVPLTDPNDRRTPALAFIATLESPVLTADPDRLSDADLQGFFRDAWWSPLLR